MIYYIYIYPPIIRGTPCTWLHSKRRSSVMGAFKAAWDSTRTKDHWAGPGFLKCRESAWESMKSITNISLVNKLSFSNEFSSWGNDHLHCVRLTFAVEIDGSWHAMNYGLPDQHKRTASKDSNGGVACPKPKAPKKRKPCHSWGCCVAVPPSDLSLEAAEEVLIRNLTSKQLVWLATAVSEFQNPCFVLMRPTDASLQVKIMHHIHQCLRSRHL